VFLLIVGIERVHGFDAVKAVLTVLLGSLAIVAVSWALGLHHWPHHPGFHHPVAR
jgi:hypothetical protein